MERGGKVGGSNFKVQTSQSQRKYMRNFGDGIFDGWDFLIWGVSTGFKWVFGVYKTILILKNFAIVEGDGNFLNNNIVFEWSIPVCLLMSRNSSTQYLSSEGDALFQYVLKFIPKYTIRTRIRNVFLHLWFVSSPPQPDGKAKTS